MLLMIPLALDEVVATAQYQSATAQGAAASVVNDVAAGIAVTLLSTPRRPIRERYADSRLLAR